MELWIYLGPTPFTLGRLAKKWIARKHACKLHAIAQLSWNMKLVESLTHRLSRYCLHSKNCWEDKNSLLFDYPATIKVFYILNIKRKQASILMGNLDRCIYCMSLYQTPDIHSGWISMHKNGNWKQYCKINNWIILTLKRTLRALRLSIITF